MSSSQERVIPRQAVERDNVFANKGIQYRNTANNAQEKAGEPLRQPNIVVDVLVGPKDRVKEMNESNYNFLYGENINLSHLNAWRNALGRPSLKTIYCKICKSTNSHFWFKCPSLVCKVCRGNHRTQDCIYMNRCCWCEGLHPAYQCNNPAGLRKIADSMTFCKICKRYGHPARNCPNPYTKPKVYARKRWYAKGNKNKWKNFKNKGKRYRKY